MSKKNTNGSGRNSGEDKSGNIIRFPSLADRDRARKKEEKKWQQAYKAERRKPPPFFNAQKIPVFTRWSIGILIGIHLILFLGLGSDARMTVFYAGGFVPGYFTGTMEVFPWFALTGIVTHIFIHGSWFHLLLNCVMGLAFGVFFERIYGAKMTGFFVLLCGIAGALTYFVLNPFSTVPVIGASGSISGLFGAVICILNEQGRTGMFSGYGRHRLWMVIGFWALLMIGLGILGGSSMAWQAHLGGFLAGAGLYQLMRKGKIHLPF